jgi:hypothetical protein
MGPQRMTISARYVLLCAALMAPAWAAAYIPDTDPAKVSAAVGRRLGDVACRSSFGVAPSAIRTWRYRSENPKEPVRASVNCQADSSFKGMPARYRVECVLRRTNWQCDAAVRELLVRTDAGLVKVIPNDVSLQRTVDLVLALATVEYLESQDGVRIPIRGALSEGCWLRSSHAPDEVEATCGTSGIWVAFGGGQGGALRIVSVWWVYP